MLPRQARPQVKKLLVMSGDKPHGKALPARNSRHLYDFFQLLNSAIKTRALKDLDLLEHVAKQNSIYFAASWASYKTARKGTLKLSPPDRVLEGLKKDYKQMEAMFYRTERPKWELMLKTIAEFELEFNEAVDTNSARH